MPTVTAAQMREVDRIAVDGFGISLLQMMENTGRALAELTRIYLSDVRGRRAVVLAGRGGNGGGGMAAARRLAIWGADVRVALARPEQDLAKAPRHQLATLRAMGIPVHGAADAPSMLDEADVVLDALLGYSLDGPPREPEAAMIRAAGVRDVPILALDLPSGLHPDTGLPGDPTIRATRTLTLALPKVGLLKPEAARYVGALWLADISVPAHAFASVGVDAGKIFAKTDLVRLT